MLQERLSAIATAITVTVMFSLVVWVAPLVRLWSLEYAILSNVAEALAAVAIYRSLADALRWLFKRVLWIRRIVLGKSFIEGTWAGHYVVGTEHRLTLEFIDQSVEGIIVHGREFTSDGVTRANWSSDAATVNLERVELIYAYTCTVFQVKHMQQGLGIFRLVFEDGRYANKLDGYAVDTIDGDRDPNVEFKLSDRAIPDADALTRARKIFAVP